MHKACTISMLNSLNQSLSIWLLTGRKLLLRDFPQVLSSFSRQAKNLLTAFHREIELRTMNTGTGAAGIAMLGQQLKNYEQILATLATQMIEIINGLQREANREFTPVIARNLSSAYDYCTSEVGPGQFNRMKAHMSQHFDNIQGSMFAESCEEVKGHLLKMCKQVSTQMSEHTDGVFVRSSVITSRSILEHKFQAKLCRSGNAR